MCDQVALRMKVEELVKEKLDACEPFTTVDISHPIIKDDPDIRHYQVRAIVNEMDNRGEMQAADFQTSNITVHPDGPGGKGVVARLWHPMGFDPADYKSTSKVLVRGPGGGTTPALATPNFTVPQPSQSSLNKIAQPVLFKRNCKPQSKNTTLNIPTKVIKQAGLKPFDPVEVTTGFKDCKVAILPSPSKKGDQRVDKEGRIRLHGWKAKLISGPATACVVADNGKMLIKVS